MADFDLIIVGTGIAGRTAIEEAVAAGMRVGIVDEREYGGTCALRGCHPKKVLFSAAEVVERAHAQAGIGIAGDTRIDWPALMAFRRSLTDQLPASFEASFKEMGATPLHGVARFASPSSMRIGNAVCSARCVLIATGALPMRLGIEGEDLVIDSERFLDLDDIPERVAFIGGGYVSFELAGIAAAAGAKPVILHRSARLLKQFDPDLVALLVQQYAEEGIEVHVDAPVNAVRRDGDHLVAVCGDGREVPCDLVVHGAGRAPDIGRLSLEKAAVSYGRHGIELDEHLRSVSNPNVYAAGDAAAVGPPLTPVGILQARIAVRNMVKAGSATFAPAAIPTVLFSLPPLAAVGISEEDVGRLGLDAEVRFTDTSAWESTRRLGLKHTGAKTVLDRASGRVLGAQVLGHHAEEIVNLFALAIATGATSAQLKDMLWAYPTASSEIVYLVEQGEPA